ncbi:MAG: M14 family metallopeptidase [Mariniphaga sp.]
MKKYLKILLTVLCLLILGFLGYTYFAYNNWSVGEVAGLHERSGLKYYQDSYLECRPSFRVEAEKLKSLFDSVDVFQVAVESNTDKDLTIDVCYVPATGKKTKLLILSSGIHGIEGFVGSAVQQMVMEEFIMRETLSGTGVLFIHAMNPYGFKYSRRVTENNIDLNRNSDIDSSLFSNENKGYDELYGMLNPSDKANTGSLRNQFFMLLAIQKMVSKSMGALRQAILQGQYEHPEGLYFGGKKFEPQIQSIAPFLVKYGRNYEKVLEIDLHTGYGELGTLHIFPNPVKDPKVKSAIKQVFEGYKVDWADTDGFYTITGSFSDYIGKLFAGKLCLPTSFEYGTLNSQTTMGSIHSLHNMILENEGFHYGYLTDQSKEQVQENFREMYYPSSLSWRSKVINDSRKMMAATLKNFQEL